MSDLGPGTVDGDIRELTVFSDRLFFTGRGPDRIARLWSTDGTAAGTAIYAPLLSPSHLTVVGDRLWFDAIAQESGRELWFIRADEPTATDLNGDGAIDALDAAIIFANWGNPGRTDFNGDGVTDAADAAELFVQWTSDSFPLPGDLELYGNPIQSGAKHRASRADQRLSTGRRSVPQKLSSLDSRQAPISLDIPIRLME